VFESWSGGGCSGSGFCTVIMDGDKTVTADFRIADWIVFSSVLNGN
jgi:hypothetical protein